MYNENSQPGSMKIIEQFSAARFALFSGGFAVIILTSMLFFAEILGHVDPYPHVPMISDCAVQAPESYISRIGLATSAILLWCNSVVMLFFQNYTYGGKLHDAFCFFIVTLACIGLGGVSAINESEAPPLHGTCAVIFFAGYLFYVNLVTLRFIPEAGHSITIMSCFLKVIITIAVDIDLLSFVYFHFTGNENGQAITEWIGTYLYMAFIVTFLLEYHDNLEFATLYSSPSRAFEKKRNVSNVEKHGFEYDRLK